MKRDILLLVSCLCVLVGVNWLGREQALPAAAVSGAENEWTLILDAGHGGEDGGASTAAGQKESDINLAIVLKTQALMAFLGVEPQLNALFISIHQNHFTDSRYSGTQVFFNSGDLNRQWGEDTQEIFRQILNPQNNREAKPVPDGIYLFDHISCPAILVECGFLSNGEEAALLVTDAYQRKVAVALTGAYFHELQKIPTILGGE